MNMTQLKKDWKKENKNFIEENKKDKIKINYAWICYCDGLCKNGEITQKQWQNLTNIF